jgi:UPF0755 protein
MGNNLSNGEYKISGIQKSKMKVFFLIVFLFCILLLCSGIYFFIKINKSASSINSPVAISINKGDSATDIIAELKAAKVISNEYIFLGYLKLNNATGSMMAGEYLLNRNMSMVEVADILTSGKIIRDEKTVTVTEGLTNKQISEYLYKRGIGNKDELEQVLKTNSINFSYLQTAKNFVFQGFLFPDTYKLGKGEGVTQLVDKMLLNFSKKINQDLIAKIEQQGRTLKDVIILASIIEKEVGRNKTRVTEEDLEALKTERRLVASVFYNRLKIGQPLESDATVNYVTGKSDRQALIVDTKVKSAYNTYVVKGLPPTPICNPGEDSIMAAIEPTESDYYYFLSKIDGEAVFSRTYEEHLQNKAKYLK